MYRQCFVTVSLLEACCNKRIDTNSCTNVPELTNMNSQQAFTYKSLVTRVTDA
jgi:hypothetical protein